MGIITRLIPHYTQPQEAAVIRSEYRNNLLGYFPNDGLATPTYPLTFAGNAAYGVTKFGKAILYDGTGDYTSAGDAFYSDEYTILVTFNANVLNADNKGVIVKRNLGTGAGTNEIWLEVTSSGISFHAWQSGGAEILNFGGGLAPVAGKTYTVGIDIPPGSGTAYMYVNGALAATGSKTGTIVNGTADLQFGALVGGAAARYWNGYIGPAAFWSKRRSDTQQLSANPWQILTPRKRQIYVNTVSGVTLAVADVAHAHSLDAVSFTQAHNLAQADITHGHTLDAVSLTQAHNLVQADIAHAHTLDNVVLNVDVTLSVADIVHGHSLETIALSQTHNLTQADVAHAHVVDAASFTQVHNLAQADVAHGHTLDNVVLNVDATLAIADISHGNTAEALTLTQTHNLVQADVSHAHSLDSIALTQAHNLVVADVAHAHTTEAVTLTVGGITLSLDIVLHAHTLDNVNLTQAHNLSLVDLAHGHTLDNVIFTFDGVQLSALRQMYSNSQVSRRSNNQASRRSNKQTARRP